MQQLQDIRNASDSCELNDINIENTVLEDINLASLIKKDKTIDTQKVTTIASSLAYEMINKLTKRSNNELDDYQDFMDTHSNNDVESMIQRTLLDLLKK